METSHVALESCRCDEYKEVVDNFHFFFPGTLHHLIPRLDAPEGYCFAWVKCKTSYEKPQFFSAKLVRSDSTSEEGQEDEDALQKACRECKMKSKGLVEKCVPPRLRVIDGVITEDEPLPVQETLEGILVKKQEISSKWIPVLPGLISQK